MNSSKFLFLSSKQISILAFILALEIIGSLILYNNLLKNEQEKINQRFESTSKELTSSIEKEIHSNLDILSSINALYSVTNSISRNQFKKYNKKTLSKTGSIQALEWIPIVKLEDKDLYESTARKNGLANFQITELIDGKVVAVTNRVKYYPVFYLEPLSGNETALGFDLGSNPTRLTAINKCIESEQLVATSRVNLVQEKNHQNGLLVFSPIKKQDEIIGFGLGVYRIKDLITNALDNLTSKDYNLVVFDVSADKGNQLLVQLSNEEIKTLPDSTTYSIPEVVHFKQIIKIADREWLILCTPTQAYLNSISNSPELILIICLLVSITLSYFTYSNFRKLINKELNETLLETKVNNRTTELEATNQELNQAIKSLSEYKTALDSAAIVAITDQKGNIEYANEKFLNISKYSESELIGKNHRIVNSGYHTKDFWKEMWTTIEKGNVWRNEIRNKAKDGTYYWLDTTIVPLIHNNKPTQYLAIRNDITNRKNIERKIINSIIYSQEQDREYFSEDLHEGLAQTLAGLSFQIQAIESRLEQSNDDVLKASISTIKEYIYKSLENTKNLAKELMPRLMMKFGLIPSIEQYIKNIVTLEPYIEFITNIENLEIDKEIEITIYRSIVAIIKRAKAPTIKDIFIEIINNKSCLQIKINVIGSIKPLTVINSDQKNTDYISIQKRIELYGGQMIIDQDIKSKQTNIIIKFEW